MSLSIKHDEADRLARELARLTGESLTEAVLNSLRERLQRQRALGRKGRLRDDLLDIGHRCAALPVMDDRPTDEILGYDEHGLPSTGSTRDRREVKPETKHPTRSATCLTCDVFRGTNGRTWKPPQAGVRDGLPIPVHEGQRVPERLAPTVAHLLDSGVVERVARNRLVLSRRFHRFFPSDEAQDRERLPGSH